MRQPGRLKGIQAMGWYMEEANMAQVSINISDHEETPLHTVYEEVYKEAKVSQLFSTYLSSGGIYWYEDGAGSTVEENSSVFSLIQMR